MRRAYVGIVALVAVAVVAWASEVRAEGETFHAYLPYLRRDPTPTRTPTPTSTNTPLPTNTPVPRPTRAPFDCRNYISNGGFEELSSWQVSRSDLAGRSAGSLFTNPHSGGFMLSMRPEELEKVLVATAPFDIPSKDRIVSAKLIYFLAGITVELIDSIDVFAASINKDQVSDEDDIAIIDTRFNQHAEFDWAGRVFDVASVLKGKGWRKITVSFFAENDISDNTNWHVDDVSLEICTKWQNALDNSEPPPPMQSGAPPSGLARDIVDVYDRRFDMKALDHESVVTH